MPKILIVEDDRVIAEGLHAALTAEGYDVLVARDGDQGLHLAREARPDLLVVDVMLPHLNGFELTTELRRSGEETPIIVLSARDALKDRVRGLDLGADDYLTKPFELDELLARIRRRLGGRRRETTVFGGMRYDWETQRLEDASGAVVPLSSRELRLLEFVLRRAGRIVTRGQIIETVWGDDYDGTDRTVDNVIVHLRKKLGAERFETVRGQGWRFVTDP